MPPEPLLVSSAVVGTATGGLICKVTIHIYEVSFFLISSGCYIWCTEPVNCLYRRGVCHNALAKIRDGKVLNEADKHDLESLAREDRWSFRQIFLAAQRLHNEGKIGAADRVQTILNRARPGTFIIREDESPRSEGMDRDIEQGGSAHSHSSHSHDHDSRDERVD